MASRRNKFFHLHAKPTLIFPSSDDTTSDAAMLELDESDVVWNTTQTPPNSDVAGRKTIPTSRSYKKLMTATKSAAAATSLPVSIPDWSKILKGDYKDRRRSSGEEEVDEERESEYEREKDEEWIPPHEYLARTRGASLSVHEGVGRTLKGRDLRRVRNAVWKKTGFED